MKHVEYLAAPRPWWFKWALPLVMLAALSACVSDKSQLPKWQKEKRAQAHVDLGMNYLKRGQMQTAEEEFTIALEIDSSSDAAYHGRALLHTRLGQPRKATALFARAVSLNKDNFIAVNDYGIHLCQQGSTKKGLRQLRRIEEVRQNPQQTATYLGLGVCHWQAKQLAAAKDYLKKALAASPALPQALLPMAEISREEKNYLSARAFLERYFATGALTPPALLLAVQVEQALNDNQQARRYARKLRAEFPKAAQLSELPDLL